MKHGLGLLGAGLMLLAWGCGPGGEGPSEEAGGGPLDETIGETREELLRAGRCADLLIPTEVPVDVSVVRTTQGSADRDAGSCGGQGSPEQSYEWIAPANGTYHIALSAGWDTVLYVRDGCGGAELACNDEALEAASGVLIALSAGQRIAIHVDGKNGEAGLYDLVINPMEAGELDPPTPLASLKTVRVPGPKNLHEFVKDKKAALVLGKALFWDMQLGSDGVQSCASCHFAAGIDTRSRNTLNPGSPNLGGTEFSVAGPNDQLTADDFPFHLLSDPDERNSTRLRDSDDVVSSQGVFLKQFVAIVSKSPYDDFSPLADPVFNVEGVVVRRVEPRQAPTAVNAVFNDRNFWDGRAQADFNGVNPFGKRDEHARVVQVGKRGPSWTKITLEESSLASQAVGPPLSDFEMSHRARSFPDLGKKMLSVRPLALQKVHKQDSVLGKHSRWPSKGLDASYKSLIQKAFRKEWWDTSKIVRVDGGVPSFQAKPKRPLYPNEYTVMEYNFSLFFGLAVQVYEATLVSDETRFDRYMEGDRRALTTLERQGLEVFKGPGKCVNCHGGAEFTNASVANARKRRVESMIMGNGEIARYDNGFYNIGVRPPGEDRGVGGTDPFGAPLAEARRSGEGRTAVENAFKTPGLRNAELTAPYFHNGGQLTLRQVVDFYNRGGDFNQENRETLDPDIDRLRLSESEREALVAFLKALTDERVRYRMAPFDHPELRVPNGHPGDGIEVTDDGTGYATDQLVTIPAVGRHGGPPLPTFLQQAPAVAAPALQTSLP